jgi:abortive infection bacteriophage resistance protein
MVRLHFFKNVIKITVGKHLPLWVILEVWGWNKFKHYLCKIIKSKGKKGTLYYSSNLGEVSVLNFIFVKIHRWY